MDTQMPLAYAEFDRFGAPTPAGIPATARLESVEVAVRCGKFRSSAVLHWIWNFKIIQHELISAV